MGLTRAQLLMLGILISGSFLVILNQTLVTPALPSIMADMVVDASTVQWLTTGFTLVNAVMIPVTAYLTDRFNTRNLFIAAMSAFTVGSLLAGWGPSFAVLLVGRLVQAAGAGILMPMVMTVMLLTFPVERRGAAMGWFNVIIAFAPAIGPTVGGIIVDSMNWHIMFFLVTGLALLDLVFAIAFLAKAKDGSDVVPRLDKLSVVLSTLGFGIMLFGFSAIGSYGPTPIAFIPIVIGAAIVVVFFRRQLKSENPMLRVQVLANRRFAVGTVIGMIVQASIMANAVLIPIYVQDLCGYSATMSGLVMLPGAIIMGVMGPIAGRIFDKKGPRKLVILGTSLMTVTTLVLTLFLTTSTSMIVLCVVIAFRNFAMVIINMPVTTWGMNALDNKVINHGNAVNNTLRQVSGSLGTAIVVSVYSIVSGAGAESLGVIQADMIGVNVAFGVQAVLCLSATILAIVMVKNRAGDAKASDPRNERRSAVEAIMHRDVYMVPSTAKVADAVKLFIEHGISAAPIVDQNWLVQGAISDGDVMRALSNRGRTYLDPVVMMMGSGIERNPDFDAKLEDVMNRNVMELATIGVITVDAHASLAEICRVMGENHLKKVPVIDSDDNRIVGVINRSDITQYALKSYLERRDAEAVAALASSTGVAAADAKDGSGATRAAANAAPEKASAE